jgi:hypothetical protein
MVRNDRVPVWQQAVWPNASKQAEVAPGVESRQVGAWQSIPPVIRGVVWLAVVGFLFYVVVGIVAGYDMAKEQQRAQICAESPRLCGQ